MGHMCTSFIDDSLLVRGSLQDCRMNVMDMVRVSEAAGFVIHPKSVLVRTQRINYLGFVIDSNRMTIELTPERRQKILMHTRSLLNVGTCTIRQLSEAVGLVFDGG